MNFGQHGCQKLVAMEMSRLVITSYKCENNSRRILGKVAKFGGYSFDRLEVIHR